MFAYEAYGVKPDIMTSAKALGCGVPVGAFVLNEKVAEKVWRQEIMALLMEEILSPAQQ